jgi:hypothetical protein
LRTVTAPVVVSSFGRRCCGVGIAMSSSFGWAMIAEREPEIVSKPSSGRVAVGTVLMSPSSTM